MSTDPYSGTRLLEDMQSATNYNHHVAALMAKYARGEKILEIGAGLGTMAQLLKERHDKNVHCFEPDESLRQKLSQQGLSTLATFPNDNEKWDTIYSINVLEHVRDDRALVGQMAQGLAPGGVVIAYVPAFMLLYSSVDKHIGHHRRYTAETLKHLFSEMNVLRCEYADSLGFLAGLTFKAFDNGTGQVSKSSIQMYDTFAFPISKMLDAGLRHLVGKNVLIVAENP